MHAQEAVKQKVNLASVIMDSLEADVDDLETDTGFLTLDGLTQSRYSRLSQKLPK